MTPLRMQSTVTGGNHGMAAARSLAPSPPPRNGPVPVPGPFAAALDLLERRASAFLPFEPKFEPIRAWPATFPAAQPPRHASHAGRPDVPVTPAIDGSHAVLLDTGALWVVAVRAASVSWPGPRPLPTSPLVIATLADEAPGLLAERFLAAGLEEPPSSASRTADGFAEAWRGVEEMEEARHAIAAADEGALILLDGALHGLAPAGARLAQPLLQAAAMRGVRLAAVAKRSSLHMQGVPLVAAVAGVAAQLTSGSAGSPASATGGAWRVPVPGRAGEGAGELSHSDGVFVARLHGAAKQAYRVDLAGVGTAQCEETWSHLAALSRDAVYCGYPYPLALAHNHVALTAAVVAQLRGQLESEARRRGPAVARLLEDPHAILDRNL